MCIVSSLLITLNIPFVLYRGIAGGQLGGLYGAHSRVGWLDGVLVAVFARPKAVSTVMTVLERDAMGARGVLLWSGRAFE